MVSPAELDRKVKYVLIRVECVERTDYYCGRYSQEELNDELEEMYHVKINLNEFINQNQDLTVDQLCVLKELKHRLYGAINKLKDTKLSNSNITKQQSNDSKAMDHHLPSSSRTNGVELVLPTSFDNFGRTRSPKKFNGKLNGTRTNLKQCSSKNGPSVASTSQPLAFGGTDCSTMIRFFVNQINKNNLDIISSPPTITSPPSSIDDI